MSSLWTPSGEHQVEPEAQDNHGGAEPLSDTGAQNAQDQVESLRERLAETPAETVLANHCYGLFELGAIYLSADPPRLEEARLAIDAFGLIVEGLEGRLGEASVQLREALSQIQMGFVQVESAHRPSPQDADPS